MKNYNSLPVCQFGDRKVTVFDGIAFYQSTGQNSGHKGLWFPMFGAWQDLFKTSLWLVKPSEEVFCRATYLVSSHLDLEKISWMDLPEDTRAGDRSAVLLQWQSNGQLYARFLAEKMPCTKPFFYGYLPSVTSKDYQLFFKSRQIISAEHIEYYLSDIDAELVHLNTELRKLETSYRIGNLDFSYEKLNEAEHTHVAWQYRLNLAKVHENESQLQDYWLKAEEVQKLNWKRQTLNSLCEELRERKYYLVNRMRTIKSKFYQACFSDPRLHALESDDLDQFVQRILNLWMLAVAGGLPFETTNDSDQALSHQAKKVIGTSYSFHLRNISLEAELPSIVEKTGLEGANKLNAWIQAHGGFVVSEKIRDPLEIFHSIHALDNFILNQRLIHISKTEIKRVCMSMGFEAKQIDNSIKSSDHWLETEITQLANLLAKSYWLHGYYMRNRLELIITDSSLGPYLTKTQKENLVVFLDKSKECWRMNFNAMIDKIMQFLKAIFSGDRVSRVKRDLRASFFKDQLPNPLPISNNPGEIVLTQ